MRNRAVAHLLAFVGALGALVLPGVVVADGAGALATGCLGAPPTSAAHYQSVADFRGTSWGTGDLMSMATLPDGRNLFAFGDTVYAPVNPDGSRGPLTAFGNNSLWVQQGNCFSQLDSPTGDRSWIAPSTGDGTVFWPGGAAVAGNRLHIFLTRTRIDNVFGTPLGSAVATYELPSLELARVAHVPFHPLRIFGSGAVYDGGYLYSFGSRLDPCFLCFAADMYVARVPEQLVAVPGAWQYYRAGSGWISDPMQATPVINDGVSNTNVVPYRNGFLLVTKPLGIVSPEVTAWWAPNPEGPWSSLGTIFSIPQPPPSRVPGYTYLNSFTYTPTILPTAPVENGRVLLGYNVGSFDERDAARDALGLGPRFVAAQIPAVPAVPPRAVVPVAAAPWAPIITADLVGYVRTANGGVPYNMSHTTSAVGVARTITGQGAWVTASDGGVFSVGDAQFYGSMGGIRLNQPVVGIAATPTGLGYWLVASDGGVFSFGDAQFFGSMGGTPLNWPVTDIAATPSGRGYYMVGIEGAVFTFGDARYAGNAPYPPSHAVAGIAVVPGGYRLVDASGRVFNRGAATGPDNVGPPTWIPVVDVA